MAVLPKWVYELKKCDGSWVLPKWALQKFVGSGGCITSRVLSLLLTQQPKEIHYLSFRSSLFTNTSICAHTQWIQTLCIVKILASSRRIFHYSLVFHRVYPHMNRVIINKGDRGPTLNIVVWASSHIYIWARHLTKLVVHVGFDCQLTYH